MILGKVARIISEKEVVLNVGSEDGVEEGMEFVIYAEGDHITDPETGEDLGPLEAVKARIVVFHVMDKMCRAQTTTYHVDLDQEMYFSELETRQHTLDVSSSDLKPMKEDLKVRDGDKVKSV